VTLALAAPLDGRALWYLSRGTGAVSLLLLTLSVALGVVNVRRWSAPWLPRFVVDGLHRTVSLFVVVTVAIHVITTLLDSFAPIRIVDVVLPFVSAYRPLWIGLGALAFDLLLALVITSLARARLGYRGWRAVHWFAYACWPVALLHGLGSGSDVQGGFAFVLSIACAATVAIAVAARLIGTEGSPGARAGAFGAIAVAAVALAIWLPAGPLARGWAARAGTPRSVLAAAHGIRAQSRGGTRGAGGTGGATRSGRTQPARATTVTIHSPLSSPVSGRIGDVVNPNGGAVVQISLHLQRGPLTRVSVQLFGQAAPGGGISLTHGQVALGTSGSPATYQGSVSSLNGGRVSALARRADGSALAVALDLQIDRSRGHVGGTANLSPAAGG
jgi:sulfoxide reductase heme-binding subunit YedZ